MNDKEWSLEVVLRDTDLYSQGTGPRCGGTGRGREI